MNKTLRKLTSIILPATTMGACPVIAACALNQDSHFNINQGVSSPIFNVGNNSLDKTWEVTASIQGSDNDVGYRLHFERSNMVLGLTIKDQSKFNDYVKYVAKKDANGWMPVSELEGVSYQGFDILDNKSALCFGMKGNNAVGTFSIDTYNVSKTTGQWIYQKSNEIKLTNLSAINGVTQFSWTDPQNQFTLHYDANMPLDTATLVRRVSNSSDPNDNQKHLELAFADVIKFKMSLDTPQGSYDEFYTDEYSATNNLNSSSTVIDDTARLQCISEPNFTTAFDCLDIAHVEFNAISPTDILVPSSTPYSFNSGTISMYDYEGQELDSTLVQRALDFNHQTVGVNLVYDSYYASGANVSSCDLPSKEQAVEPSIDRIEGDNFIRFDLNVLPWNPTGSGYDISPATGQVYHWSYSDYCHIVHLKWMFVLGTNSIPIGDTYLTFAIDSSK